MRENLIEKRIALSALGTSITEAVNKLALKCIIVNGLNPGVSVVRVV